MTSKNYTIKQVDMLFICCDQVAENIILKEKYKGDKDFVNINFEFTVRDILKQNRKVECRFDTIYDQRVKH